MNLLRLVLSRSALALIAGCFLWLTASAVHVKGYTRKDGTYVAPHERTSPNHTKNDNYSTKGNVNPYTGKEGTKPRDAETAGTITTTNNPVAVTAPTEPASVVTPLKRGTINDLKGGMSQAELFQVIGAPTGIEGKQGYEIWTYPTGTVYFSPKAGVMAWKENKLIIISENSVPAKSTK